MPGYQMYGVHCLQISGPTGMFSTRRDNDAYDDDDPTAWLMELIEYNRNVPWMQTTMSVRLTHRAFIESAICKCWWNHFLLCTMCVHMGFSTILPQGKFGQIDPYPDCVQKSTGLAVICRWWCPSTTPQWDVFRSYFWWPSLKFELGPEKIVGWGAVKTCVQLCGELGEPWIPSCLQDRIHPWPTREI